MPACAICNAELVRGSRGPAPTYCSPRCRKEAQRRREAVDWTGGVPPVRIERIEPPRIDVADLGAAAVLQQRSVFVAAKQLARETPDNLSWRWQTWLTHAEEFDRLFAEADTTK